VLIEDEEFDMTGGKELLLNSDISGSEAVKLILRVRDEVFDLIGGGVEIFLRRLGYGSDEQAAQNQGQ